MPGLGVIVVDEEHDSSYKQDQAPRYHARDVAIKRAQIEGVPIILGSATPSLEMYRLCRDEAEADGRYHYLSLPNRVRGAGAGGDGTGGHAPGAAAAARGASDLAAAGASCCGRRIESGQQAILLLNRRGYSNFVFCTSCGEPIKCKYCDTTMTYHRSVEYARAARGSSTAALHTGQMLCHYCLATSVLPDKCPICGKKLSLFGLGTQRVEEELGRKMPDLKFARVDSDSMRTFKDYESTLAQIRAGRIAGDSGDADDRQGAGLSERDAGGSHQR